MANYKKKVMLGNDDETLDPEVIKAQQEDETFGEDDDDAIDMSLYTTREHKSYECVPGYQGRPVHNDAPRRDDAKEKRVKLLRDEDRHFLLNGDTYDLTPEGYLTKDGGRSIAGMWTDKQQASFMKGYSQRKAARRDTDVQVKREKIKFSPAVGR